MKTRISYLSTARVIGIVLVVLGHSYPFNVPIPQGLEFLRTFIYSFHMPLFIFISGFLAARSCRPAKDYISGRAKRLLIPYFILSLAAFLPKVFVQQYLNDNVSFSFAYLLRSELVPRENVWGHFWFLPVAFFLSVFSALMKNPLKKRSIRLSVLAVSYLLLWLPKTTNWFSLEDLRLNLFWYMLGYTLSGAELFEKYIMNKKLLLGLPAALFLLIYQIQLPGLIPLIMIGFTLCFAAGTNLCRFPIIRKIEQFSFTIFLLSWPFQAVAEVLLNRLLHLSVPLCMAGMFAAGLAGPMVCICIIYWVEKYIPIVRLKPIVGM